MVCQSQKITLRRATATEVLPFVCQAARYDTTGGAESAQLVARRGGYLLCQGGKPFAGFTIEGRGNEIYITSYAGKSKVDLIALIFGIVERARGVESVAFQTRRRGLIRKAARHGYRVVGSVAQGVIMRKKIK